MCIELHVLVRRHRLSSAFRARQCWFLRIAEARVETRFPFEVHYLHANDGLQHTMEQEPASLGQDVQVVDPDVRGYVYSLVTAVRKIADNWLCAFTDVTVS